jgi:hypothetical protein
MRQHSFRWPLAASLVVVFALASPAMAADDEVERLRQDLAALRQLVEQLQMKIDAQEARIRELRAERPEEAAPPAEPQPPPAPAPPPATPSPASSYFNPSIAVIGNFLGVGGTNEVENLPAASLRESEVSLQAVVDPYARADFYFSLGEEGVDVEEGFATFTALPASFLVKVGRMRSAFGKINTLHLHVLPWPDEPLPVVNLLGEDGWIGSGLSVAKLIPLPGDTFSEATVQVFRGDAPGLFEAPNRGDLAYNGHYRVFRDLTEATNLDLGLSYAYGPNGATPDSRTRLAGVDATLRWKPLRTASYRSLSLRGEFIRSRRDLALGEAIASGWFLSGEYQLAKRWFAGARYEAADRPDDGALTDRGQALTVTFWPSEFSQLRAEMRRRAYAGDVTASELLFQLQFAIGAHGAHPF